MKEKDAMEDVQQVVCGFGDETELQLVRVWMVMGGHRCLHPKCRGEWGLMQSIILKIS